MGRRGEEQPTCAALEAFLARRAQRVRPVDEILPGVDTQGRRLRLRRHADGRVEFLPIDGSAPQDTHRF